MEIFLGGICSPLGYCFGSSCNNTNSRWTGSLYFPDDDPVEIEGNGDGTVPYRSLQVILVTRHLSYVTLKLNKTLSEASQICKPPNTAIL